MGIKVIVLAVCGFLAIKWHFDEEKRVQKRNAQNKEADSKGTQNKEERQPLK